MNDSTPGFPVLHDLLEFAQIHVHWVGDAIQTFHPLSPASSPALNLPSIRVFCNKLVLCFRWPIILFIILVVPSDVWPPQAKSWLIRKDSDAGRDWGQEEKGTTEDEMAGWHHWLDGRESKWTLGVGDGQGGLACCDSWGPKELDTTEWLNWMMLVSQRRETSILML